MGKRRDDRFSTFLAVVALVLVLSMALGGIPVRALAEVSEEPAGAAPADRLAEGEAGSMGGAKESSTVPTNGDSTTVDPSDSDDLTEDAVGTSVATDGKDKADDLVAGEMAEVDGPVAGLGAAGVEVKGETEVVGSDVAVSIKPEAASAQATGWRKTSDGWRYYEVGRMCTDWKMVGGRWYYLDPSSGVMRTGWCRVDGSWYLLAPGGQMLTGWRKVGENWYLLSSNGRMRTGWCEVDGSRYLLATGSGQMLTGWQKVGRKWYLLSSNGRMRTGWCEVGDSWYYLDASGAMLTGWQKIGGKWYLLAGDGRMRTGWQRIGSSWYYLRNTGSMATGWLKYGGEWYLLAPGGQMLTGWQRVDGSWYLLGPGGQMLTGWQKLGENWYLLSSNGRMRTGWCEVDGSRYLLATGSGQMLTGWQKVGRKWYLLSSNGRMRTGWCEVDGKRYYLGSSGAMCTGWCNVGGSWYLLAADGHMLTGWQKIGGKWYYLASSGAMCTGWCDVGGKRYYLGSSGVMCTGCQKVGGKWHYFDSSGVWLGALVYEDLYGSTLRSAASQARRMSSSSTTKCIYSVVDIDGDGIKELIVDDKGLWTGYAFGATDELPSAKVYTITNDNGVLSVKYCGKSEAIGGLKGELYYGGPGSLYAQHNWVSSGIGNNAQYRISLSNGRLVETLLKRYEPGSQLPSLGSKPPTYNVYQKSNTSIDFSGLRNA